MLVKQGRAKLAVKEDWHADPARMKIEAIANDFYNKCIPQSAPAVLFYDEENCIMVRDARPSLLPDVEGRSALRHLRF